MDVTREYDEALMVRPAPAKPGRHQQPPSRWFLRGPLFLCPGGSPRAFDPLLLALPRFFLGSAGSEHHVQVAGGRARPASP